MIGRKGSILDWLALAISSTLFAGFIPGKIAGKPGKGGGTAGSLVAIAVQFALWQYMGPWAVAIMMAASFALGLVAVGRAEKFMFERWGPCRRHTGEKVVRSDFNQTCVDEFHGQMLASLPVWFMGFSKWPSAGLIALSFALFRFFDAKKPGLIKTIETRYEKTASFGTMIDDTAAGIAAAFVTGIVCAVCYGILSF
jgi:phosphatidylglycerophosphatase A